MRLTTTERDIQRYATRVAWYYYKTGLTQNEIAKKLGLNRARVINILNEVRSSGFVSIHVSGQDTRLLELEDALRQRWGLREVMVIPETPHEQTAESLGMAGAQFLEQQVVGAQALVGLGWGSTVMWTLRHLGRLSAEQVSFVTLCGGVSNYLSTQAPKNLGSFLSGLYYPFHVIPTPLLVNSAQVRDALLEEEEVRQVMQMGAVCDMALVGIGAVAPSDGFHQFGYKSPQELEVLRKQGAIGEIFGEYFNEQGELLELEHHARLIATGLQDLKRMKHVVGIAGGSEKVRAVQGALTGEMLHSLITDEATACALVT
ncbi:MAG: sugar-binding transcriptional regulator [SAR324 cluster bacterium]|nr:sugar-binding transcriptional regulator [SAR324 cluster bacterium]